MNGCMCVCLQAWKKQKKTKRAESVKMTEQNGEEDVDGSEAIKAEGENKNAKLPEWE